MSIYCSVREYWLSAVIVGFYCHVNSCVLAQSVAWHRRPEAAVESVHVGMVMWSVWPWSSIQDSSCSLVVRSEVFPQPLPMFFWSKACSASTVLGGMAQSAIVGRLIKVLSDDWQFTMSVAMADPYIGRAQLPTYARLTHPPTLLPWALVSHNSHSASATS